jgi:UDP-N-acetylmuramoylalanine--D-glutamate ligase
MLRTELPATDYVPAGRNLDHSAFETVVASPGIAVEGDNVIGDIELFAREARAPVVAITGSNGKSTVTMLVQEMLNCAGTRALAGGNIGTPALDLLDQPVPDYYVLELSSFQLETTSSLHPVASVVLNLSEDHLDRYAGMAEYAAAKLRIYDRAACRVFNRDDPFLASLADRDSDITFGLGVPGDGELGVTVHGNERWLSRGGQRLAPVSALQLHGEQNVANMLAAIGLVCGALQSAGGQGYSARIAAGLAYRGLPHRCETVPSGDSLRWVNDSKGTNVGATLAAIRGSGRPLILIAGGQGKGADFTPLRDALEANVREVILLGEDAVAIEEALGPARRVWHARSLEAAVDRAREVGRAGDTVLFSPACASFDMFENYQHRGDCFRRLVREKTGV